MSEWYPGKFIRRVFKGQGLANEFEKTSLGIKEWYGVRGLTCVRREGEKYWTCKFKDKLGRIYEIKDVLSIVWEEFPGEPIPLIKSIRMDYSPSMAYVTLFGEISGPCDIITANFLGDARLRKEVFSLFIFMEAPP